MTKREKWLLHRLEFERMLQGYESTGKDPIRLLRHPPKKEKTDDEDE